MIFSRNDPHPLAMTWITVCIQVGSPGIHLFCNVCLEQKGLNLVFKKRSVHNVHIDISFFGMMKCARQGANDFKPSFCQRRIAESLVETTKLNCIARKPRRRASLRQCSAIARPIPWPRASGATMKAAFATCDPPPDWLGRRIYVPTMYPLLSETFVRVFALNQYLKESWRDIPGSKAYVSPAAITSRKISQIASRSAAVASRISTMNSTP